jgi:hypothetical protein
MLSFLTAGHVNFTSLANPNTGVTPNQGFEGLTASASGDKLYALLQSETEEPQGY